MRLRYASMSRKKSMTVCILAYMAAGLVALAAGYTLRNHHPLLVAGIADIAAMATIFVCSVIFDNSSLYDPYWSVVPVFIVLFWIFHPDAADACLARQIAVSLLLCIWAVRLTYNWIRRWRGLGHEDWRYMDFREKTGKFYWPVSFAGIHFVPTVLVFAGCFSLYIAVAAGTNPFGVMDILAIIVTAAAAAIETVADRELNHFLTTRKDERQVLSSGLWEYSRHPNYFGEVLFWWGLYLFALAADTTYWWTIFGPIAMTALFLFISVPMIEKHMEKRKPGYTRSRAGVSKLVPWLPGK